MGNDVEEGEISDAASVEITEEILNNNNKEVQIVTDSKPKGEAARVWTMRDLCNKYPSMCRGYTASGLYSFAWAQAVQNKPLSEIFVMEGDQDDMSKKSSPSASVNSSKEEKKEADKIVVDESGDEINAEKEEGELEEGEIDLDSESTERIGEEFKQIDNGDYLDELLKTKMTFIQETSESLLNVVDADKSFQDVCLKLQNTLDSLREVVIENDIPSKDAFSLRLFSAIQAVNKVFCSMNNGLKEQNRGIFSRLLLLVKSCGPSIFLPNQIKEIDVMVSSLDHVAGDSEKGRQTINWMNEKNPNTVAENVGHTFTSANKSLSPVESLMNDKPGMSSESFRQGLSGFNSRGVLLPLLDLHKDHDADSLPSPTRETTPCIPAQRASLVNKGRSGSTTVKTTHEIEDKKKMYYETDAFRAVSSYQQKFGSRSFFSNDKLPSPTPSEESGDGEGDTVGEVSSSSATGNSKLVTQPISGQPVVSSSQRMETSSMQGLGTARDGLQAIFVPNPAGKASGKSRDPRLRFANSDVSNPNGDIIGSRKQKTAEELVMDGPASKRPRNGLENSGSVRDVKTVPGISGWLVGANVADPRVTTRSQTVETLGLDPRNLNAGPLCPNTSSISTPGMVVTGNESAAVKVPGARASLPDLLKDFAQNPAMLINLLRMGQEQRLAAEMQHKPTIPLASSSPPNANSVLGTVPLMNVAPSMPTGIIPKPAGTLLVASHAAPTDELGKIRMKPRDPRRILHGNMVPKSGSMGTEQFKINGLSTPSTQAPKDNLISQKQQGISEANPMLFQSGPPPDIARQFTKNLKNIANMMSVSQASSSQPLVSEKTAGQPGQARLDRVDGKAVGSNIENPQVGTGSAPEVGPERSHPQNTWSDVEHLFERYDDQQKAAIQRERARRIEEQRKMFAARKLCLVLDLDHTLLNSAKFVEVDPVHDEILRKKEEQDREKPQRHLFRFPHMGMWTKLRPGIWTFLERASKLFELHLYTMGNKLYATEMAKVLDPKGVLFAGRVISRGDDGDNFDKSKDLEGVLGMESAVVIIDDSVRVWPHNKLNLIVVERYTYFPCSRRQFGLLGPSLLEIDRDERPEDGTLASSLAVIERIHQNFFSHQSLDDVDVRNILAEEQRKILAGCRIVFSRVFPVGEANPHLHPLWQTAEQFGAVCLKQIDDQVTHVVANSLGTDKVNWALSMGRHVVYPGWVEASALLYRRANEQDFAIKS